MRGGNPNTTISGTSSARQRSAISMFRGSADDGPTLNGGLVALCFSRGSGSAMLRNPIALDFQEGVRTQCPHPPLDPHMRLVSRLKHVLMANSEDRFSRSEAPMSPGTKRLFVYYKQSRRSRVPD